MKEEKYYLLLDEFDQGVIIRALNDLRNRQKEQDLSTDIIDDIILKTAHAPKKKFRIVEREPDESR